MRLFAVFLISLSLAAAEPEKKAPTPVPDKIRAQFWRARAEFMAAQDSLDKASSTLNAAVQQLTAVCSSSEQIAFDQAGEPACQPKPEPPKADPAKPEIKK